MKLNKALTLNTNASKFLGLCQVCKVNKATDTHHINHQEYADKNGNINHFHMLALAKQNYIKLIFTSPKNLEVLPFFLIIKVRQLN